MLFKSQVYTQASGSIGGLTYAHAPSGMYTRGRAIPVNPNTTMQQQPRNALTELVTAWRALTAAQRAAWSLWAANTPFVNALGDSFNISGQNAYVGANTQRLQSVAKLTSTLTRIDAAPTIFNRGDFTTPTSVVFSVSEGITINFVATDDWVDEDDSAMLVFQGRPQNGSRNFFKGPWRLIRAIEGDSVSPPDTPDVVLPATLAAEGFTLTAGQNCSLALMVTRADGRYSTRRITGPTLVGA